MYCYMSATKCVDPSTGVGTPSFNADTQFRCRGEVGADDDPSSFKAMMQRSGYKVHFTDDLIGQQEGANGPIVASASELGLA